MTVAWRRDTGSAALTAFVQDGSTSRVYDIPARNPPARRPLARPVSASRRSPSAERVAFHAMLFSIARARHHALRDDQGGGSAGAFRDHLIFCLTTDRRRLCPPATPSIGGVYCCASKVLFACAPKQVEAARCAIHSQATVTAYGNVKGIPRCPLPPHSGRLRRPGTTPSTRPVHRSPSRPGTCSDSPGSAARSR